MDDDLFLIKLQLEELKEEQKKMYWVMKKMYWVMYMFLFLIVFTLFNDGMMGQLWEFRFSDFI